MARQVQTAEVSSFVKGLITEASPLTFPEQASLDESNFVLNTDGSRRRRYGMDFEEGYTQVTATSSSATAETVFSTFSWENAGGDSEKTILVVQAGGNLLFFDGDTQPFSQSLISNITVSTSGESNRFSYAVVDGELIVATGEKLVRRFVYDGNIVSSNSYRLHIRDLFGVAESEKEGANITKRDGSLTSAHRYNLRNQTWASPRRAKADGYTRNSYDPIKAFYDRAGTYPSNADAVTYSLGAWLEDSETEESFLPDELKNNPPGNYRAPQGYFIIDALNRGASRTTQSAYLYNNFPSLDYPISGLPTDATPGGPTCVEEYAGRIWYAGFPGEVIDGDDRSPRLSSYVFYSQLVTDPTKLNLCYQEGDPTSSETPDLIDTDGGFIRIDSAYGIKELVSVGSGILVVAENGVWMISGGSDYGFSATNNMRRKVSDRGAIGSGAIVRLDDGVIFWADDAIYQIGPNEYGDYTARNMTQSTIQTLYDEIPSVDKKYAQGVWDSYDQKIRWVYNNRSTSTGGAKELVLDVPLGAFYPSEIGHLGSGLPRTVSPVEVPPFQVVTLDEEVTVNGVGVTHNGESVTQETRVQTDSGFREVAYLTLTSISPLKVTFSSYRDLEFKDWKSVDGVGVDAKAYLLTGYLSGGDFLRNKDVPYVQFYLRRTESGFTEDETGNLFPENESSCLVQAQWEWTNSANSNRWGRQFQAYRYRRHYLPSGGEDDFDTGHSVVTTRSKLRGKGKVVSLLIESEEGKDLQLLGWTMLMGIGNGY